MRLVATGVELWLYDESPLGSPAHDFDEPGERPTPEERADAAQISSGELVRLATVVFADVDDGTGAVERLHGVGQDRRSSIEAC